MNYKICVENEAESKEAQELFVALGGEVRLDDRVGIVCLTEGKIYTDDIKFYDAYGDCKELTIPQLRGMVVLKRNDVSDATHTDGHYSFYVGKDKNYFFSSCDKAWRGTWKNVEILKPIEKPMKEYLNKLEDGTYKLVLLDSVADGVEGLIEIPEGSMFATGSDVIFRRNNYIFDDGAWELTDVTIDNANFYGLNITWQRETLSDKVASAEVARQEFIGVPFSDLPESDFEAVDDFVESNVEQGVKHPHYKKDISHLDTLDIYRVTELFNPHSCGAHIAKKALCSGQRGHKDLLTDIQDIIDTAERWKEMLIEDGNP